MKLCRLFRKQIIAMMTVVGVCLLGGCDLDEAVEADTDIASASATDIITVPETENVTSSETVEETASPTDNRILLIKTVPSS